MANFDQSKKWKKRTVTVFSLALAATLSLGALSACTKPADEGTSEPSKVAPTDTQVIKNGNFEFYADKLVDDDDNGKPLQKLNILNSPDSWSFTSGSPSSETKSGVIDTTEWDYFAKTGGYQFSTYTKGSGNDAEKVTTFKDIAEAYAHWEDPDVSAYDRLKFLSLYEDEIDELDSQSDEAKLFSKYNYSVSFKDVEKLNEEVALGGSGNVFELHEGATAEDEENTSVLMIHNNRTADDQVRGTAQYYTSSTTITLAAGTAAKVSVWVRTDALYHYKDTELTARGGAYIGVRNTVGGTTLDDMQIYNIHTDGAWEQYTLYVRASTFATSTFRIILGLGQGSSDDKYYAVDGYAFFDDVECEIISHTDYESAVFEQDNVVKHSVKECSVDSEKEEKRFDYDLFSKEEEFFASKTFALDLFSPIDADNAFLNNCEIGLTSQVSGSKTYTSADIVSSYDDSDSNFARVTTLADIAGSGNAYLKKIYENDFLDKFPFDDSRIVMLMSQNRAAYTATLQDIEIAPDSRLLISFFAKTSAVESGLTGAGATIVDGANKTYITSFDSTVISAVDIDSKSDDPSKKDIYKGWVQCFFFLENSTDSPKTFHIELTYGPTTILGTNEFSYGDGYAAFTNFETKLLTKTEYSYASTGDRAKKVSLTGEVAETKNFDSVSATEEKDIESRPALPANFIGVLGGSDYIQNNEETVPNVKPDGVDAGLLNYDYAENYLSSGAAWLDVVRGAAGGASDPEAWWSNLFGSARQPLVIINRDAAAYGYFSETATVSASSYRRISMNVKVSSGATAHIYLTDVSKTENAGMLIYPDLPLYTYWYDEDGNIVNMDPSADDFDEKGEVLYELQPNGLFKQAGNTGDYFYANLHNFDTDDEGNLVTKDGTIAYYAHNGVFYAYYNEETDVYSTEVHNLPTENARYDYSDRSKLKGTEIVVRGTDEWVTVNFYVHTGNEAKDYRLEVWSGNRTGTEVNPANSYVFFDNYSSVDASSSFDTLRDDTVSAIKDVLNEESGLHLGEEGYYDKDTNLPDDYASYYTFTFYDANTYLRYDETTDTDELGNPYYQYDQSTYEEQIASLYYEDTRAGQMNRYSLFLDYSATDVTVAKEYPNQDDDADEDNSSTADTDTDSNFWLLLSSGLLAIVLILVILILIVRLILKKFGKRKRVKPAKDKRYKPTKPADEEPDEVSEE